MPYFAAFTPTADVATSASANTLVDHLRLLTTTKDCFVTKLDLVGKGAAQTQITGIEVDLIRYTTPSTVGTTQAFAPRDANAPSVVTLPFSGPTVGATATYQWAGGMMSSGQGGFVPINPDDDAIYLMNGGGAKGNLDLESQTEGTAALNFKYTMGVVER